MNITKQIAPAFVDFVFNWDYETYLLIGGYGSSKSYNVAFKIILKCLQEKRKVLVVREVYDTIKESCYDLISEILDEMGLLAEDGVMSKSKTKVKARKTPLEFEFPNGSRIIFKGMDKPAKVKSLNGVSIAWLEECSEIKYSAYKELLGRIRTNDVSMHYILSCNPVGKESWVYRHFFTHLDDNGKETTILSDERLYKERVIIQNNVYYHHSVPEDNPFLPVAYINRLDDIKTYDLPLWQVAKLGRFGANGTRVLPNFVVASSVEEVEQKVKGITRDLKFIGFDFGFEESFNAIVRMAVDDKNKILYLYDEIYKNHVTDDVMADDPRMIMLKDELMVADNEDPKAIAYYKQRGYKIRKCRNKFAGSRLSNTRKIKRFKQIVCSPKCKACISELKELTYKRDPKGNVIYDEFNIDPHTFSAIWYGLDTYTVADVKEEKRNSKR